MIASDIARRASMLAAPRTSDERGTTDAGFKAANAQLPSPHSFVKLSCCDAIDHLRHRIESHHC